MCGDPSSSTLGRSVLAASELFKDTPPTLKKAPSTKSYLRWIFYATKKSSFISLSYPQQTSHWNPIAECTKHDVASSKWSNSSFADLQTCSINVYSETLRPPKPKMLQSARLHQRTKIAITRTAIGTSIIAALRQMNPNTAFTPESCQKRATLVIFAMFLCLQAVRPMFIMFSSRLWISLDGYPVRSNYTIAHL